MVCEYCYKEIKKKKNINISISYISHLRVCVKYKEFRKNILYSLTKEFLYEEYIIKEKGINQIAKEINLKGSKGVEEKLKQFNIKKRTKEESNKIRQINIKKTLNKRTKKQKNLQIKRREKHYKNKYGKKFINGGQVPEIKEKIKQSKLKVDKNGMSGIQKQILNNRKTCQKKYGVDNVFQLEEVKKKIYPKLNYTNIVKKAMKTKIKKYGTPYTFTLNKSNGKRLSNPVLKIKELLDKSDIIYKMDFYINDLPYYVDFYLPKYNLIIEVNGTYWHADPRKYIEEDVLTFKKGKSSMKTTAKEIWEYDKNRCNRIKNKGYNLKIFWEFDIYNNFNEIENYICKINSNNKIKKFLKVAILFLILFL